MATMVFSKDNYLSNIFEKSFVRWLGHGLFQKTIVSEYEDIDGYFWSCNTINFILIQSNINPNSHRRNRRLEVFYRNT